MSKKPTKDQLNAVRTVPVAKQASCCDLTSLVKTNAPRTGADSASKTGRKTEFDLVGLAG